MTKKLEDCAKKVQAKGKSKSSSYAICNASLNKAAGKPSKAPKKS
jgi:hypothetical protein